MLRAIGFAGGPFQGVDERHYAGDFRAFAIVEVNQRGRYGGGDGDAFHFGGVEAGAVLRVGGDQIFAAARWAVGMDAATFVFQKRARDGEGEIGVGGFGHFGDLLFALGGAQRLEDGRRLDAGFAKSFGDEGAAFVRHGGDKGGEVQGLGFAEGDELAAAGSAAGVAGNRLSIFDGARFGHRDYGVGQRIEDGKKLNGAQRLAGEMDGGFDKAIGRFDFEFYVGHILVIHVAAVS